MYEIYSTETMTILLTPLSNNVHQDAAGSFRTAQLGDLTVFIDIWQRPSMIVYLVFCSKIFSFRSFYQVLRVWEEQFRNNLACDNKVTNRPNQILRNYSKWSEHYSGWDWGSLERRFTWGEMFWKTWKISCKFKSLEIDSILFQTVWYGNETSRPLQSRPT